MSGPDKKIHTYQRRADGKDRIIWQRPDESTYETIAEDERSANRYRKLNLYAHGAKTSRDALCQSMSIPRPTRRNREPKIMTWCRLRECSSMYVPESFRGQDADGNLHRTQTTTTTTPVVPSHPVARTQPERQGQAQAQIPPRGRVIPPLHLWVYKLPLLVIASLVMLAPKDKLNRVLRRLTPC